jgi:predicted TIM-barrel fold metal-dependent hydrolase
MIDHLAGASGDTPTPEWTQWMQKLAAHPNLFIKLSSFYDVYAGRAPTWQAPTTVAAYRAHFDVLMNAFGPRRLAWGSNWPVNELGGSFPD